jgi:phage terminase large subunit
VTKHDQALEDLFRSWRDDPYLFVSQCLNVCPSKQQIAGLREVGNLVRAKQLRAWQMPIPEHLNPYLTKRGISIRSGHGTGKDAWVSWVMIWFMFCFSDALIPCTAPTAPQLRAILWKEVAKWLNRKNVEGEYAVPIRDHFDIQMDRIKFTATPERSGAGRKGPKEIEAGAHARTAAPGDSPEKQSETLAGFHSEYMMIVVDEASGVPDPVFKPLEGAMTQPVNFIIMIANPTRTKGVFRDTHKDPKTSVEYVCLHWDARDSELVDQNAIALMEAKYGVESNTFRIRVRGDFPTVDENSLIPYDWAERAQNKEITPDPSAPTIAGLDVSRFGSDKTDLAIRQGGLVRQVLQTQKLDTMQVCDWVMQAYQEFEFDLLFIDTVGVGAGVFDVLKRLIPGKVRSVNVSEEANDKKKFVRLRDELFWKLRTCFEDQTISIPEDADMVGEVSTLRFEMDIKNRVKVEGKKELRARNVSSPNKLDALMLTMAANDAWYTKKEEDKVPEREDKWARALRRKEKVKSWLGA